MVLKSRAERVKPLEEFPLEGGGKYRFNLEGQTEVKCPNWPNCPSLDGVSADGWRQVKIPFGERLKEYIGRCGPCQHFARRKTAPLFHESGATILRAVNDSKDRDNLAYLCICCCPPYEEVVGWLKEHSIPPSLNYL